MPFLIDEANKEIYSWEGEEAVVGRTPDNTISIPLPGVSRHHFRITCSGDQYVLEDLGSRNGTKVNGKKLDRGQVALLNPGDKIQVSKVRLRFEIERPSSVEPREGAAPGKDIPKEKATVPGDETDESLLRFADESAAGPAGHPPGTAPGTKENEILCSNCGASNLAEIDTCWNCNARLVKTVPKREQPPTAQRSQGGTCPNCQTPYPAGATHCASCGMALVDRRAVVAQGYAAQRRAFFLAALIIALILSLSISAGATYLLSRRRRYAAKLDKGTYYSMLRRAKQAYAQAKDARKQNQLRRALKRYKEAESLAHAVVNAATSPTLYEIQSRAKSLRSEVRAERRACQEKIQDETRHRSTRPGSGDKTKKDEKTRQGRLFFHGGKIMPGEGGLERRGTQAYFPEESALRKILARTTRPGPKVRPLLHTFLKHAWAFQANYCLEEGTWKRITGAFPRPMFSVPGVKGKRFPEGIKAQDFPGLYLARLVCTPKKDALNRLHWDNRRIVVNARLYDTWPEIEPLTRSNDISVLARNVMLLSSAVHARFVLEKASRSEYTALEALGWGPTPPVLHVVFRITSITEESNTSEISHTVDKQISFIQSLKQVRYLLGVRVVYARWFKRLSEVPELYIPVFLEKEPEDGLYGLAKRAMGKRL